MKLFVLTLYLCITTIVQHKLDYPRNADDITSLQLLRPDKKTNGKNAETRDLESNEIKQLLFVLGNAQAIPSKNFQVDYYIIFTTKNAGTKKLMINKNKIKGYDSDQVYEIRPLSLLLEF